MDDFLVPILITFGTGALIAAGCLYGPWRVMVDRRRRHRRILAEPGECLLASHGQDLAALQSSLHEIVSILLGEVAQEDRAVTLDPSEHAVEPVTGVVVHQPSDPAWTPPGSDVSGEERLRRVGEWIARSSRAELLLPLSESMSFPERDRKVACHALLALLPNVTVGDSRILSLSSLYNHLTASSRWRPGDDRLALAILEAIERISHVAALPQVLRLLAAEPIPYPVRKKAKLCRQALEARIAAERIGRTLLRPSADPSEASDVLLRPAGRVESDDSLLLRTIEP